jgi:hypothetical protein
MIRAGALRSSRRGASLLALGLFLALPAWDAGAQQTPMAVFKATGTLPDLPQRDAVLQEELAYHAGLQAYVFGLPLVHIDNWRARQAQLYPELRANTLLPIHALWTPANSAGTAPQVDTVYSVGVLTLKAGPALLTVPAGVERYNSVQIADAYGMNVRFISRRTNGQAGGRYLIAGPGYAGDIPAGVELIRMPTDEGVVIARVFAADPRDVPAANAIQDQFTLRPLGAPQGTTALAATRASGPLAFYERMSELMRRNPPGPRMAALVASFGAAGVDLDRRFDPQALDPAVARGLERALQKGPELVAWRIRHRGERVRGWNLDLTGGDFGDDTFLRAAGVTYGLVVNTPQESLYFRAYNDSTGAPLHASRPYQVRFAPGQLPDCGAFWSLTTYDANFDLVANPQRRYAVNDRDPRIRRERDGSLVLYVQRAPPKGREANWVATPAEGPFAMTLRCYEPRPAMLSPEQLRVRLPVIVAAPR